MAKKNIQKFYTHIKQEGEAGAIRGKIPVQMAREMGAGDGDIIEWEVQNGDVVGGSVMSKADKKAYLRENGGTRASTRKATPAAKVKPKVKAKASKPVVKTKTAGTKVKSSKPVVKSKKRKTSVSFDEDERPTRKPKFKLKKPR